MEEEAHLIALLSLGGVLGDVLVAGLVVHDELVIHKVKAVRLGLKRVCYHFLDFVVLIMFFDHCVGENMAVVGLRKRMSANREVEQESATMVSCPRSYEQQQ